MVVDQSKKQKRNKMANFNYKKWVIENKYGKPLFEQLGSASTGSASTGSASTGSASTGSASTGSAGSGSAGSGSAGSGSGCDVSSNSPCAQLHLGSFANNFTSFMANKACTGTYTFESVVNRLMPEAMDMFTNRPNQNIQWNSNLNAEGFSSISTLAREAFGTGSAGAAAGRPKFKRKLAKAMWANCMNAGPDNCCGN